MKHSNLIVTWRWWHQICKCATNMQYACITQNYACITQNYASFTQIIYAAITQSLRRKYANTLRKIRRGYANNLRNNYADITQCLRKITQRWLRTIRNNYANVFTQTLRTFPMLTQLYYADFTQMIYAIHYALYAFITQIIYADFTQIIYAIHYAVYAIHLRKYIYAITIISLRSLRKYRFSLRKFTQRATCWCSTKCNPPWTVKRSSP